jgi:hypothetical protein
MNRKTLILIVVTALLLTALTKLLLPSNNFSPIGAIALMSGAFLGRRIWAFLLPLAAVLLADFMISGTGTIYSEYLFSTGMLFVYLAYVAMVWFGGILTKRLTTVNVISGSLVAAVLFFLLSNFGSWIFLPEYTKDFSGLILCYERAIPFFRATLFSQLLFSLLLYFGWGLATRTRLVLN